MPGSIWFSLKKSIQCKSEPSQVHNPRTNQGKKLCSSGCSRALSNLRDVVHGSKRHTEKLELRNNCSPRSLGSSDLLSPITHEVLFNESTFDLKINSGFDGGHGITGHGGVVMEQGHGNSFRKPNAVLKRVHSQYTVYGGGSYMKFQPRIPNFHGDSALYCRKKFKSMDAVEEHHVTSHAVSELVEGDSSRKVVEIICQTSSGFNSMSLIERILKVQNMHSTVAKFEEYREIVKTKASKLATKHPRCIADGNELLRFHGTVVACSLGNNGTSSLCTSEDCEACKILRNGFTQKDVDSGVGIFTSVNSERALKSIEVKQEEGKQLCVKKALLICRVIAGRVHKPVENFECGLVQSGFDSLAGKIGLTSQIEELYVLNPRALLPCFVVICKS